MEQAVELQILHDISTILDESEDIIGILTPILVSISHHTPMVRGAITLLNRDTKEILIEAAYGFTQTQKRKGRYLIGEGITGIVVKSGQPIIILDISKDSRYINKTGAESELIGQNKKISFICSPIKSGKEVIGTLNISFEDLKEEETHRYLKLLSVIASMLARVVKIRQELREENERLVAENLLLKQELDERYNPERIIG
ncbi:MAG: GAF domain-containing protein, partial [Spirochaetia bacterium]|nr:GAF domain-containing protein [Spirochaetia bacterium]